jgi:hypothetical protein
MKSPHARTTAALFALAGIASIASAQVRWRTEGGHDAAGSGRAVVQTITDNGDDRTITMSGSTDNGDTYEIRIKNDDVIAKLNGKRVPDDRIRLSDSTVELLDESGNVVATMDTNPRIGIAGVPAVPSVAGTWSITPPDAPAPLGPLSVAGIMVDNDPPKVMVGINMSDVDPTLREHFGLDEDAGFVVDNVVDDLPAAKAGIKARDIIISIDGTNVTNATLRDVLKEKDPGQKVKVRILRKGEQKDVSMELEAYDASKLGIATTAPDVTFLNNLPIQSFSFGNQMSGEERESVQRAMEDARRAMEEAMAQMHQQGHGDHAETMRQANEQMQRAMEELKRSEQGITRFRLQGEGGDGRFFAVPSTPTPPAAPGEPGVTTPAPTARRYQVLRDATSQSSAAEKERVAALESRLDELNDRLDRLDDRIGKLLDRLERDN